MKAGPSGSDNLCPLTDELGYEIRDQRESKDSRPSIEAWVRGCHWPVVRAVEHDGRWLVLVDARVADLAGVIGVHLTAVEAINAAHALEWVNLVVALYVKAAAK